MKPKSTLRSFLSIAGSSLLATSAAQAQSTYYWDSNSTAAGFGNTAGTWGTSSFLNTDPGGAGAGPLTAATTSLDTLTFGTATLNYANASVGVAAGGVSVGDIVIGAGQTTAITALGTAGNTITIQSGITKNAGSAAATLSSPITLGGAQTWTNNSSNLLTVSGAVSNGGNLLTFDGTGTFLFTTPLAAGAGGITKNGSGRLELSNAAQGHTGPITVNGGVLSYGDDQGRIGSGNITLNGGVIDQRWQGLVNKTLGAAVGNIQILGGASGFSNNNGGHEVRLNNNTGFEVVWGSAFFDPSTLVLQSAFTQNNTNLLMSNLYDLNGSTRTIQVNPGIGGASSATFSNIIRTSSGTAGIIKTGGGILNLNGANTYNGGTTINDGVVAFGSIAAMPNSGIVAVNNTTLGIEVGAAGDWTGSSTVAVGTLGGVLGGLGGAGSSTVTYTGNVGLRLNLTANTTYSGDIADVGTSLALTKVGNSTLTLSGTNNSYTGATRIEAGQFTLDGSLTGGGAISTSGAGQLFQSGTGVISGASTFTQNSSGTSQLFGNNSYSGATTVSAGTLIVGSATALSTGTINLNGGIIQSNDATARTFTNAVTVGGNPTVSGTGNLTFSNTAASALGGNRQITVNTGINATFAQAFTGSGNSITKAGAGTLTLSGSNSGVTGGTSLTGGTLILAGATALPAGAITWATSGTTLRFENDANLALTNTLTTSVRNATRTLVVDRLSPGAAVNLSFSSAPNLDTGTVFNFQKGADITSGTPTITFSGGIGCSDSNNASLTVTPTILTPTGVDLVINGITSSSRTRGYIFQGDSTGNRVTGTFANGNGTSIRKAGTGTWTFAGISQYAGTTEITGGTLALGANNILPNVSAISIGAATLDAATFDDTAGTLDVTGAATINLGVGANLAFTAATATWAGSLNVTGTLGATSLRFGTSSSALSLAQLAVIRVNGSGLGTYVLDPDGYLIPGGGGPGPLDNFLISAIGSPQTVGTPITGITLTARDASNATVTGFTGTVNFSGTGGFTGTSATFTAGVLSGVSIAPTTAGINRTFIVTDGVSGKTGTATFNIQTQYQAWALGGAFGDDANNDGVSNGLAFLLGASGPNVNALGKLPTITENAGALVLTFDMRDSASRGAATLSVEHSSDLGVGDAWEAALVPDADNTVNDVVFDIGGSGTLDVEATIPVGKAAGGRLFGRLKATE